MTHYILQFRPWIGRIDAKAGAANHLRGEVGVEPFRGIVAGDRETISRAKAERIESDREAPRIFEIFLPCRASPDAEVLLAQRHGVAQSLGLPLQRLRHRRARKILRLPDHAAARLVPR